MTRKRNTNTKVVKAEDTNIEQIPETKVQDTKHKTEKCKVLYFNEKTKELDVIFKDFGVKIVNVPSDTYGDFVFVKYLGEIGKPDFKCWL